MSNQRDADKVQGWLNDLGHENELYTPDVAIDEPPTVSSYLSNLPDAGSPEHTSIRRRGSSEFRRADTARLYSHSWGNLSGREERDVNEALELNEIGVYLPSFRLEQMPLSLKMLREELVRSKRGLGILPRELKEKVRWWRPTVLTSYS